MATPTDLTTPIAYEEKVRSHSQWAWDEAERHFRGESDLFKTMRALGRRLDDLHVPYAVAGAMAMEAHDYRRLTDNLNILVTRGGLQTIHERLEGLGCALLNPGSKNLRDTERGVRIKFLVAGEYPGDGKPKPVAFPNPAEVAVTLDGIRYLSLPTLVELKLASGMSDPGRLKDLGDAQEMIRVLGLSAEFAAQLNPFVRDKYLELWRGVHKQPDERE
jgi:hypothetical protein